MSKFKIGDWWSIEDFGGTQTEAIETAIKHLTDDGWELEWFLNRRRNDLETIGKWSRIGIRLDNGEITLFKDDYDYEFQPNDKSSWSTFNKQQYECPYAVIEELQAHVETLEEALEKVTKELLELREKVNSSTETSFKPIADMTMEDWYTAKAEGWVFEMGTGEEVVVDSIMGSFNDRDHPIELSLLTGDHEATVTVKGYFYYDRPDHHRNVKQRIK